jgi:Rod binding domain-containing protein
VTMNITLVHNDGSQGRGPDETARTATLESERRRLKKAAGDLESLFLYQLLKTMRQTVPKSDMLKGAGFGDGLGKEIYTQMFDQEISKKIAGQGKSSIAEMIYASMERAVERQFRTKENSEPDATTIMPGPGFIRMREDHHGVSRANPEPARTRAADTPEYGPVIDRAAEKYCLPPVLIEAVIRAESNFDPAAVSTAGAKGLMQLADSTATEMNVRNVFDPEENIEGGARYLRLMLDRFGDLKTALAAYNAGPGTVERYGGIPPYPETIDYIERVLGFVGREEAAY